MIKKITVVSLFTALCFGAVMGMETQSLAKTKQTVNNQLSSVCSMEAIFYNNEKSFIQDINSNQLTLNGIRELHIKLYDFLPTDENEWRFLSTCLALENANFQEITITGKNDNYLFNMLIQSLAHNKNVKAVRTINCNIVDENVDVLTELITSGHVERVDIMTHEIHSKGREDLLLALLNPLSTVTDFYLHGFTPLLGDNEYRQAIETRVQLPSAIKGLCNSFRK